jgi:hypothetical protein
VPVVNSADPSSGNASRPEPPRGVHGRQSERIEAAKLGDRVKPDPENESPDPTEDLGVAVRLNPRRGNRLRGLTGTDCYQVPHTQESPWQQHESEAGTDVQGKQSRKCCLS